MSCNLSCNKCWVKPERIKKPVKERARLSRNWLLLASLIVAPLVSCAESETPDPEGSIQPRADEASFSLRHIATKPHSNTHFTQGLFFWNGNLYESVGLYGQSALIKYSSDASRIAVQRKVNEQYFAEGAAGHADSIYQLTWKAEKALAYRGTMLSPVEGFNYQGEGWGLTSDGTNLWLSNGSDQLIKMDEQGNVIQSFNATYNGKPLDRLNELEWVDGWLLANRWYDTRIFVINPETGRVETAFNLAQIAEPELAKNRNHVLNGIAWDPVTQRLWVTGKNWNNFYLMKFDYPSP